MEDRNATNYHEYRESSPTVQNWIRSKIKNPNEGIRNYFLSFFPFITWITRYNRIWLVGDLVAGLTVGAIVIPQGMAYAKLAGLEPQFGLYSSFVGVMIYWFFATSKDITIGPVAVLSVLTGEVVSSLLKTYPHYEPHVVASAVALVTGSIVCLLGILRLGFIVDFIPIPALAAFMTGSALNIAMGQIPTMMGNGGSFDTKAATYLVFINFWKYIKYCNLNAVLGLSALILLYSIKFTCNYLAKRYPQREKIFFFINTLRTAFVILLYLFISWLINHNSVTPRTAILGNITRGFHNITVPYIDRNIFNGIAPYIPSVVIVILIEHIAIAKSFGRINNYVINPNQEMIAVGITNIFGPFFGGYPATGSFSRTSIKSKAGVRTPLAGVYSGIVIILAIYLLTPMFHWISQASLAAVIVHAVLDLVISWNTLKQFWNVNPLEFFIFWVGVLVTLFLNIEDGIYVTVLTSCALLLYRIAKAQGQFVGRVQIQQVTVDSNNETCSRTRNLYIPLDRSDGTNPMVTPMSPGDGIFIYRIHESFLYPNAAHYTDTMVTQIFRETKTGKVQTNIRPGDRPWNAVATQEDNDVRPRLHALILDFTGVPHIDITGVQTLLDVRKQLDIYADWQVNWHFVGLSNPWMKRALISAGFGSSEHGHTVFSVAHVSDTCNNYENAQLDVPSSSSILVPILDIDRPFFHTDLDEAYQAAVISLFRRTQALDSSELVI